MYFIANWKMYLNAVESLKLARFIKRATVPAHMKLVVCPSTLAAEKVYAKLPDNVGKGAQNGFWVEKGAYTGAVSMAMLKESGCTHIVVGHSERRHQFHETNEQVVKKMKAAWELGLTPILCIGETAEEHTSELQSLA
jgi:triosephosphate isomerase